MLFEKLSYRTWIRVSYAHNRNEKCDIAVISSFAISPFTCSLLSSHHYEEGQNEKISNNIAISTFCSSFLSCLTLSICLALELFLCFYRHNQKSVSILVVDARGWIECALLSIIGVNIYLRKNKRKWITQWTTKNNCVVGHTSRHKRLKDIGECDRATVQPCLHTEKNFYHWQESPVWLVKLEWKYYCFEWMNTHWRKWLRVRLQTENCTQKTKFPPLTAPFFHSFPFIHAIAFIRVSINYLRNGDFFLSSLSVSTMSLLSLFLPLVSFKTYDSNYYYFFFFIILFIVFALSS